MPVQACEENGRPGFRCGESGRCYTYTPDSEMSRGAAKQRAVLQCIAMGEPAAEALASADRLETAPEPVAWVSDLTFEGEDTEDGRYILPDALDWRDLPQPLMALTETGPGGHQGAFLAGKITHIERDTEHDMNGEPLPDGVVAIRARGVFDVAGENGAEVARLVEQEFMRGVSVDMTNIQMAWRDPETGELAEFAHANSELQRAYVKATIGMATVCPLAAFARARIAVTASGAVRLEGQLRIETDALTAAAAGLAPRKPPRDWFFMPEPDHPLPLTVDRDGRVYGHMALWDSCHTGYPGQCIPPPRSSSGYAYFNNGQVETQEGDRVDVGPITLETLHADHSKTADQTRQHYENTGVVGAWVRAVDGDHGIWVSGTLRPGLSEKHARDLMGARPSGDWRPTTRGGPLEMIGVLAVNVGGFPVPRLAASAQTPAGSRWRLEFTDPDDPAGERILDVLAARAQGVDALVELAGR